MDGIPINQTATTPENEKDSVSRPSPVKANSSATLSSNNSGLVKLGADLRAVTSTANSRAEFISLTLEIAIQRSPLLYCAWIESSQDDTPRIVDSRSANPTLDNAQVQNQLVENSALAMQTQRVQVSSTEMLRGAKVIAVPFFIDDQMTAVLCGLVHNSAQNNSEGLLVCQLITSHYDLWRARDEMTLLAFEVRNTATVLELVGKAQNSHTVRGACYRIANEIKNLFRCDYVAIGLRNGDKGCCKLMSISATSEFDNASKTTIFFRAAFDEAVMRSSYTVYPPRKAEQRNAALGHKKLATHLRCEAAITIPVRNHEGEILGALTIVGNRAIDRNSTTRNLIHALEHPLGSVIEIVQDAEGGFFRRMTRLMVSNQKTNLVWAAWVVTLITLIVMFVPVPYRIHCSCTAEPVVRRVSVAPFDGLLENTFVEPGDLVTTGQLLARMDAREIRFERAGIEADKTRAIKKSDTHRAKQEIPEMIMANLERAQLEQKARILEHREQNFEIVSPIDGIVLSGSIDRRENYPVTLGQSLFEVAPIDPLRVELAVPVDEIMRVKAGQSVKFRFDGFGTQTVEGLINRIRPSTTIRDDKNVFIAEAVLNNQDGYVRPGMEGHARIYGSKRRLGWTIFHRPWERFVTAIGF